MATHGGFDVLWSSAGLVLRQDPQGMDYVSSLFDRGLTTGQVAGVIAAGIFIGELDWLFETDVSLAALLD